MATTDPHPSSQPHLPPSFHLPSSDPPLSHLKGTDLSTNVAMETRSNENHLIAKENHLNHTIHAQPKEAPTKPWCSLLKCLPPSAGSVELQFFEPKYSSSENILEIDEEILKEGAMEWEHKIVGFFLDKKLFYSIVKENVLNK
ncbi:hypothetical protein FRX31_034454 [Thalictrum thalictroides]|uniref:Uncharacterized protein n=1 Tax=Thalictrum thalictroides TaxID=46969 RepID=A0A7J6UTR9_THATH|nr:hypothetical protein FRX31_034454 [Thalictrum thalictroides]